LAEGVKNKNGKEIKPNTIFRSGNLSMASASDIEQLQKLNINQIFDFRAEDEIMSQPFLSVEDIKTSHYDILKEAGNYHPSEMKLHEFNKVEELMRGMYEEQFSTTDKYKGIFEEILEMDQHEFLFHCTAGKDRTGIFGILIMHILEFDTEDMMHEYLKMDMKSLMMLIHGMMKSYNLEGKVNPEEMKEMLLNKESYFNGFMEGVIKHHGSLDNFIRYQVGVTDEMIETFRERYLV
jgi:protein-tyrosine phosphatase